MSNFLHNFRFICLFILINHMNRLIAKKNNQTKSMLIRTQLERETVDKLHKTAQPVI